MWNILIILIKKITINGKQKMDNINIYLYLIVLLLAFFCAVIFYFKINKGKFTPVDSGIPEVTKPEQPLVVNQEQNVYQTQDTRMEAPLLPPVNPIARKRIVIDNIPASSDLYSDQIYDTPYYVLDTPPANNTNELNYSGGSTQMIKIPLQFNEPYDEQLRSQDILITPYNKVKYGTC